MNDADPTFDRFESAREALLPLMSAHRFRLGALEYESGNAYAEYWRRGL